MANTVYYSESYKGPQLLVVWQGTIRALSLGGEMTLGRRTPENVVDIPVDASFVSRSHGKFICNEQGCFYVDTKSMNGTYYNGCAVYPDTPYRLMNGDVLHIYNAEPKSGSDVVTLIFMFDHPQSFVTQTIALDGQTAEINIGRSFDKDITVGSQAVSADHAAFFRDMYGWAVADHASVNGVFLNNSRITSPLYMKVGDCVRIVDTNFVFLGDRIVYQSFKSSENAGIGTTLEVHIAQRTVRSLFSVHALLRDINVTFHSGEMILILGGSGAGKTTLVNAILGYEKADGKITYNGIDLYTDETGLQQKISFVPQSDLMRDFDSVYYTLRNAADMKLPENMSDEEIEKKVIETLRLFNLDKVEDSLVKKLSGGERKRLSVAIEYIADPEVFFLDEPDSGIDGHYTIQLMSILRKIADRGKIIVIISHSANRIAENFDKVLVLAKSKQDQCGYVSFFGSKEQAYAFFDTDNLEDIVGRVNDQPDYFIQKFNSLYR